MSWITKSFDKYWLRINGGRGDNAATVFCVNDNRTVGWLLFEYGRTKRRPAWLAATRQFNCFTRQKCFTP